MSHVPAGTETVSSATAVAWVLIWFSVPPAARKTGIVVNKLVDLATVESRKSSKRFTVNSCLYNLAHGRRHGTTDHRASDGLPAGRPPYPRAPARRMAFVRDRCRRARRA